MNRYITSLIIAFSSLTAINAQNINITNIPSLTGSLTAGFFSKYLQDRLKMTQILYCGHF